MKRQKHWKKNPHQQEQKATSDGRTVNRVGLECERELRTAQCRCWWRHAHSHTRKAMSEHMPLSVCVAPWSHCSVLCNFVVVICAQIEIVYLQKNVYVHVFLQTHFLVYRNDALNIPQILNAFSNEFWTHEFCSLAIQKATEFTRNDAMHGHVLKCYEWRIYSTVKHLD